MRVEKEAQAKAELEAKLAAERKAEAEAKAKAEAAENRPHPKILRTPLLGYFFFLKGYPFMEKKKKLKTQFLTVCCELQT